MADWSFYLTQQDWDSRKNVAFAQWASLIQSQKEKAEQRKLFYDEFDWQPDGHRWILRIHFSDSEGNPRIWIPAWDDLSRIFRAGSVIETRNSKKTYEYFESGAFQVLSVPKSVEECEEKIREIKKEEAEELPF
jgi:hypothetical protein